MGQKKDVLAKVLGRRLSRVFRGSTASSGCTANTNRPSTAPQDAPHPTDKPALIRRNTTISNSRRLHTSPLSHDPMPMVEIPLQTQRPPVPQQQPQRQSQQQYQPQYQRQSLAPEDADVHRRINSAPAAPTRRGSRISRRMSFRERFWSISSSNPFQDLDDEESSFSGTRSAYVPRHAASDFSRNASQRKSVHAQASERIASRFNDDDEATLCSINCREEPDPEHVSRELDLWLSTLHRQQALQSLNNEPANQQSPAVSPTQGSPANRNSQTYSQSFNSWMLPNNAPRRDTIYTESEYSDDEYGVFSQPDEDHRRPSNNSMHRNSVHRNSMSMWAEIDRNSVGGAVADPVLHQQSSYTDLQPRTMSGQRRPSGVVGGNLSEFLPSNMVSNSLPQRSLSMSRSKSDQRRTMCARAPGIMTVVEA